MQLAVWRKRKGWTQGQLAEALGVTQPHVSTLERARNPAIPSRELMREIYTLTAGAVEPNDFYDLPALPDAQRDAA